MISIKSVRDFVDIEKALIGCGITKDDIDSFFDSTSIDHLTSGFLFEVPHFFKYCESSILFCNIRRHLAEKADRNLKEFRITLSDFK